jgi:hypothetical protein
MICTLFDLWEMNVLAEVDQLGVNEVVENLLVVVVDSALVHKDAGPHHRLIGRGVGKGHVLPEI